MHFLFPLNFLWIIFNDLKSRIFCSIESYFCLNFIIYKWTNILIIQPMCLPILVNHLFNPCRQMSCFILVLFSPISTESKFVLLSSGNELTIIMLLNSRTIKKNEIFLDMDSRLRASFALNRGKSRWGSDMLSCSPFSYICCACVPEPGFLVCSSCSVSWGF